MQQEPSVVAHYNQRIQDQLKQVQLDSSIHIKRKQDSDRVFQSSQNYLLMRNLYLVIDGTKHSMITDFKPTRMGLVLKYLPTFLDLFLQKNPLSQFGVGVAYSAECRHVIDFTTSAKNLDLTLSTIKPTNETGFSLQTCIQTAISQFMNTPLYLTQSVLLILSSPYSEDSRDILEYIEKIKDSGIRVDVISFCGVVQIFKILATKTGGVYLCPMNEQGFQKILHTFILPANIEEDKLVNALVSVGFPTKSLSKYATLCMCHLDIIYDYYKCPGCLSKICNVPMKCPVCEDWIVLPNQIMQPKQGELDIFDQLQDQNKRICYACDEIANQKSQCPNCKNDFCMYQQTYIQKFILPLNKNMTKQYEKKKKKSDCDILIHTDLKMCPGCV